MRTNVPQQEAALPTSPNRGSVIAFLAAVALIAVLVNYSAPYDGGWSILLDALFHYEQDNFQHLIIHLAYLPRLAMAVIVGAAMGIAGCVMQFVLRNPIASPTTLGVAAGAELGLILGVLLLPESLALSSAITAFVGGCLAVVIVFALSASSGYAPIKMVLSGMVVSLLFGSISVVLILINEKYLQNVFIWGTGELNQNGWDDVLSILPKLAVTVLPLVLLQRKLSALQLGDDIAHSIGINVNLVRFAAIALCVLITANVVSHVGLIGFIGIVAPAIARLMGFRKLIEKIVASALIGAFLLLVSDLFVQIISIFIEDDLPTGAMTALIGAPFFLWLLSRSRWQSDQRANYQTRFNYQHRACTPVFLLLSVVLIASVFISLAVGQGGDGWVVSLDESKLDIRAPRVVAALFAGVGLALAGAMLQRMTTNPMASPEVLGISSGVALALVVSSLTGIVITKEIKFISGTLGAIIVMTFLGLLTKRKNFVPSQLLLAGIAISAALSAGVKLALSTGGEEVVGLVNWLAGSLYLVDLTDAYLLVVVITIVATMVFAGQRYLDIINLGDTASSSLGINLPLLKCIILAKVGLLTTASMIVIGPLSFIGLMAPHMALSLHQYTAKKQLIVAAMMGASVLICADWIGRNLWFPKQFPAGLLASILGGVYFIYLMRRRTY